MRASTLLAACIVIGMGPASAVGQDGLPQLTGTWNAVDGATMYKDGSVKQIPDAYDIHQITISDQQGPVFKASQIVKPKAPREIATHAGTPLAGQPTDMVGAIGVPGPGLMIVDVGDTTSYDCSLLGDDTMQCLIAEPGEEAIAGSVRYERAK